MKKQPKYPNSAGRLLAILESLQQNQQYGNQLIPLLLGEAAPKDGKDLSLAGVKAITELHKLYADFLQDLANADMSDEEKAVLENGLSSLGNLMYPQAINQNIRQVSEAEKALLEVCATRLPKEAVIDNGDMELIQESIKKLKESVKELSTTSILRTILLELIRLSEDSINRYNIYGSKGLKAAFKSMLSEVAEVYLQNEENESDIKNSSGWKRAVEHIRLFDSVASKTMKYKPLLEKAGQFLIGP